MPKEIIINSKKYGRYVVLVDDEDFEYLNQFKWSISSGYAVRNKYVEIDNQIKLVRVFMHREIMNAPKGMDVDHINHLTTDNRKVNLRICTQKQNIWNSTLKNTNKSGYKGVCFMNREQMWCAQITVNFKSIGLGYYETPEEAAVKYNEAAIKYFGEFAVLNDVQFIGQPTKHKISNTGYRGVFKNGWHYVAYISKNKNIFRLGGFDTLEDAINARKIKELELEGRFAESKLIPIPKPIEPKMGRSGVRGVFKKRQSYWAYIDCKGKRHSIGYFKTLDEAVKARKAKEIELGILK